MTQFMICAVFAFAVSDVRSLDSKAGELVLRAVDIETGKPLPGVSFSIQNDLAEAWAKSVGVADRDGMLRLQTVNRPGYFYSIYPHPKDHDVAGLDDVQLRIVPGGRVTHTFKLRAKKSKGKDLPPLLSLAADHRSRVPAPRKLAKNISWASSVEDMPGFEGKRVTFWFYPRKNGSVSPEQLANAERIFANGKRVTAAVREELDYFQKAVPEDRGEIDDMKDVLIEVDEKGGRFWCRLPNGLQLRQHGYSITFNKDLDDWNLYVPSYLQEISAKE